MAQERPVSTNPGSFAGYRQRLLDLPDDDAFWYEIYSEICEATKDAPEDCPFPVGADEYAVSGHPMTMEIRGWGKCQAPTITALIRKISQSYDSVVSRKWTAIRTGTADPADGKNEREP